MKKIIKLCVLSIFLIIGFAGCGKRVTPQEAREALHKHLKERYGEDFEIGYIGRRSDGKETWYQAEIYPSKYKGTPREYDKYYKRSGNVDIEKGIFGEKISFVGDVYRIVLMNESANEFYLPKLKELFGENILPVFDIDIAELSEKPVFIEELKARLKKGGTPKIKGGIYIFGRVESDEDREKYREKIFEFIQYMKETGTFEYVDIQIKILDERSLTNYFDINKKELLKAKKKYITSSEYIKFRETFFKNCDKEYKTMTQEEKIKKMNNFNKTSFNNFENSYFALYHIGLISPKLKEIEKLNKGRKKEYNNLDDISLLNTVKIMYREYYRNDKGDIIER